MSHTDVCAQGICDAGEFNCALGVGGFSQAQRPTPDKRINRTCEVLVLQMPGNATNRDLTQLPCFITVMQTCADGGYERSGSFNR